MTTLLRIGANGNVKCLWTETIDLAALGKLRVHRASTIEFNNRLFLWQVKIKRKVVFEARTRGLCLDWETTHFNAQLAKSA